MDNSHWRANVIGELDVDGIKYSDSVGVKEEVTQFYKNLYT